MTLEEYVLGVERDDDIPGWLIPSLYFDFAGWGNLDRVAPVFEHNAEDILSLVALLGHFGRLAGRQEPEDPYDRLAVARWDELYGRPDEALRSYEALASDPAREDVAPNALEGLGRLYRRMERWEDLRVALEGACRLGDLIQRLRALVSLAILEEHRFHDYQRAGSLTSRALALNEVMALRALIVPGPALRPEGLHRRLARLRAKQKRKAAGVL